MPYNPLSESRKVVHSLDFKRIFKIWEQRVACSNHVAPTKFQRFQKKRTVGLARQASLPERRKQTHAVRPAGQRGFDVRTAQILAA